MRYSLPFRAEAIRRAQESDRPISQIAAELEMPVSTLRSWVRAERGADPSRSAVAESLELAGESVAAETPEPAGETVEKVVAAVPSAEPSGPPEVHIPTPVKVGAPWWAYLALTALVAVTATLSTLIHAPAPVYRAGVIVHLLSLVLGFGAILLIDWHGLLWAAGRRGIHEVQRVAQAAGPLIWTSVGGLLASGIVLRPDLHAPLVWLKMSAVLIICLNGLAAGGLAHRLATLSPLQTPPTLPAGLRRRLFVTGVASHLAWWTAIAIGLITNAHRM